MSISARLFIIHKRKNQYSLVWSGGTLTIFIGNSGNNGDSPDGCRREFKRIGQTLLFDRTMRMIRNNLVRQCAMFLENESGMLKHSVGVALVPPGCTNIFYEALERF